MSRVLLEVCCGSADDVIEAHRAGADRAELNSDLAYEEWYISFRDSVVELVLIGQDKAA